MSHKVFHGYWHWRYESALVVCGIALCGLLSPIPVSENDGSIPKLQNKDFPSTHIGRIHLDLTSPNHWVRLTWSGPQATSQDVGPFRSSPGAGWGTNNCNDPIESNCPGSRCTPKGRRLVEGLMDHLQDTPGHSHVTVVDERRAIGFHSHSTIPPFPDSQGCVRLEPYAARLIHDNSIVGQTEILIDGMWTRRDSDEW